MEHIFHVLGRRAYAVGNALQSMNGGLMLAADLRAPFRRQLEVFQQADHLGQQRKRVRRGLTEKAGPAAHWLATRQNTLFKFPCLEAP